MKKTTVLNAQLSYAIANLGHTDSLTVCDAGLPIPDNIERIDLALMKGVPTFVQTLETILTELFIERILLAEEIKQKNPEIHAMLLAIIKQIEKQQGNEILIEYVSHDIFKQHTLSSKAIVRSGECSPYANVILYSGVPF